MLLMIDNYDSFTFNLVQYFGELGEDVRVIRNDEMTLAALRALRPSAIVISPGPASAGMTCRSHAASGSLRGSQARTLLRAGHHII
jgi:anthranilate/para-aminobenzoate synthase component II